MYVFDIRDLKMKNHISMFQLTLFTSIVNNRSFKRAAIENNTTPSNVSKSMKALEKRVGCTLFRRNNNLVETTDSGKTFIPYAQGVLELMDKAQDDINGNVNNKHVLNIGVAPAIYTAVMDAAETCYQKYPELQLVVKQRVWDELAEMYIGNHFDMVVGPFDVLKHLPDSELFDIGSVEAQLYCRKNHPIHKLDSISADDLKPYQMVNVNIPPEVRIVLGNALGWSGRFEENCQIISESLPDVLNRVMNSNSFSLAPLHIINKLNLNKKC